MAAQVFRKVRQSIELRDACARMVRLAPHSFAVAIVAGEVRVHVARLLVREESVNRLAKGADENPSTETSTVGQALHVRDARDTRIRRSSDASRVRDVGEMFGARMHRETAAHFDMTNNVRPSFVSARHGIARFHAQIKRGPNIDCILLSGIPCNGTHDRMGEWAPVAALVDACRRGDPCRTDWTKLRFLGSSASTRLVSPRSRSWRCSNNTE